MAPVFYFHPLQAYQPKGFIALVPSQVRLGAASDARAWLPTDLGASCVGSFDLSSAAKVTLNSGNISAVTNDAAGTVTLTQGTGASQPPFTAGSGAFFALAGSTSLALANLATATEYHYFIVGTPNANTSFRTALWAATNEHPLLIQTGTDNVGHYISGFQTFGTTTAAASIEALFYGHITPSAVSQGATNGATPGSTASAYGATNTNAAVLGNSSGGAQGFGWVRCLVIVSGTLTDTDRQKIEGYLAWQYSTASKLPITHPYRWQAPTIALSTATSSTGTGASTEDVDTTAAAGAVSIAVTGASTETADTGNGSGTANITATGASTEGTDTTSASGTASVSASGASTEDTDSTTGAGAVTARATGASTEGADTTAGASTASVSGSGTSTEAPDTSSGAGAASVSASGASTEGTDTTSASGAVSVTGSGASTEGTDNCSGSGTVAQTGSTGTGASTESDDASAGVALTLVAGTGSALEAADTCSGTGTVLSIAFGHIKLWMGTGFVAKPVKVWNGSAWVEKPLKFWTGSIWRATGY